MTRLAFQLNPVGAALLLIVGAAAISPAAQADQSPPKELVQYIHENKRRGVDEARIKRQALAVGWSATVIDQAMAFEKTAKPSPETPPAAGASSPAPPPPPAPSRPVDQAASDTSKPASPPARGD